MAKDGEYVWKTGKFLDDLTGEIEVGLSADSFA